MRLSELRQVMGDGNPVTVTAPRVASSYTRAPAPPLARCRRRRPSCSMPEPVAAARRCPLRASLQCWLLRAGALYLFDLPEFVLVHKRLEQLPISSPVWGLARSRIFLEVSSAPPKFLGKLRHWQEP